jgi:hypothetical protein
MDAIAPDGVCIFRRRGARRLLHRRRRAEDVLGISDAASLGVVASVLAVTLLCSVKTAPRVTP